MHLLAINHTGWSKNTNRKIVVRNTWHLWLLPRWLHLQDREPSNRRRTFVLPNEKWPVLLSRFSRHQGMCHKGGITRIYRILFLKKKPCQLIAGTGWQDKPRRSILFPQGDKVGREVYCSEYDVQDEKTYGYYLMELFQYGCSPLDSCLFCHSNFIHGEQVVANRLRLLYCIVEVKNTKNTF